MNPNFTEADLIDYLGGELAPERAVALEAALASDPVLVAELANYRSLQNQLEAEATNTVSDLSEEAFLLRAEAIMEAPVKRLTRSHYRRLGVAAAAILLFSLGWWLGNGSRTDLETEVAGVQTQLDHLLAQSRSSARIQAAKLMSEQPEADPRMIQRLGELLRNDPSPNVQLAALEGLARFDQSRQAREELIRSLVIEGNAPITIGVQIQLIETLVRLEETHAIPRLRDWSQDLSIPQHLRDVAELGRLKLDKI